METLMHHYHHTLRSRALGIFLLRLVVGAIFIYAGWFKLANMSMVIPAFTAMHVSVWLTWVVAIIELLGGISLVIGWWSKFFSGALAIIIIVAMILTKMVMLGDPVGNLHWLLLASLLAIFLGGCGKWSLCAWNHHRNCMMCKDGGNCGCEHAPVK